MMPLVPPVRRSLAILLTIGILNVQGWTQLATVDGSDPTNPEISYDEDPNLYLPEIPEYPTVVYSDGTATGTITDPYTSQQPQVVTGEPDTYSLSKATVYYTAPAEPSGPYFAGGIPMRFDMGPGPVAEGYTQVRANTAYGAATGYGWGDISRVAERDRGSSVDELARDFCLPNRTPFYVDIPNGVYNVKLLVGDTITKSGMSVRADGHLVLWSIGAGVGNFAEDSFRIRVTNNRLRLEFFGSVCHVNAITIEPVPETELAKTHVYLAGDSTVSKYGTGVYPLTGWGVPLQDYFSDTVKVMNYAAPGRSSKSFFEEGSLSAIINVINPGDYLFVMFAINDSADDNSNRKTKPESTFKAYLRQYVSAARAKGAIPVFVTSQTKRTFDVWGRFTNSVQGYPQAMRDLGAELAVPVIDLNQMSIDFFTAIGPEAAKDSYMYLDAGEYPGWPNGSSDYIHFQYNGANQLARLVAQGAWELNLPNLSENVRTFRKSTAKHEDGSGYRVAFDGKGFEALDYLPLQPLEGQQAWSRDAGDSRATVTTNSPNAGMQSLQVIRSASSNGNTRWRVPVRTSGSVIAMDVDMLANISAFQYGPATGLEAYDGDRLIGGFSVDSATGELLYLGVQSGAVLSTGIVLKRGVYHHFTLEVDFNRGRYSVFVNDRLAITSRFVNKEAQGLTSAAIATYAVKPETTATETGTAYLDNLLIQAR